MTNSIDIPAWIDQDITKEDIEAIIQGGCASGAYMPAVTYYQAQATMNEHGDDVMDYIESQRGELPDVTSCTSWSGIAVLYLSTAVELWAGSVDLDDFNKEVDYFGEIVSVPKNTKFLAMDAGGYLHAYDRRPVLAEHLAEWNAVYSLKMIDHSADCEDCPFWSQSLVEV